jgi:hypothetical protein
MATIQGIISWYADFDKNVRSKIQLAIAYRRGGVSQDPRKTDPRKVSKDGVQSPNISESNKTLKAALDTAAILRISLQALLNNPDVNPGLAAEILSSLDKILQPYYDFQTNPKGVIPPDPGPKLFDWYKKYLRPLGA